MNFHRNRLDDTLSCGLVVAVVLLAFGLQVSVYSGYALDRGSVQARVGDKQKALRVAAAASEAARGKEIRVASGRP